jgi:hypothetical protein
MICPIEEKTKVTKEKLFKVASLWLIPGLVLSLVGIALSMARPAEAG